LDIILNLGACFGISSVFIEDYSDSMEMSKIKVKSSGALDLFFVTLLANL